MRLFGFDLISGGRIGKLFDGLLFVPRHTEASPLAVLAPEAGERQSLVDFSAHVSSDPAGMDSPVASSAVELLAAPASHSDVASQSAHAFIQDEAEIFLSGDTDLFVFSQNELPAGYELGLTASTALSSLPDMVTFALSDAEIVVQLPLAANDGAPEGPEFSNIVALHPANQLVAIMSATTFSVVPANAGVPIAGIANQSTFAVDLEIAVNASHLDAYGKVLFDPTGGDLDLDGHLYMVVDANGIAGYQDGADYVIELFTTNNDLHLGHYI